MYTFQQIRFLSEKAGEPLNLVTGADEMFICGQVMKSDGGIGSTYNLMPKLFVQVR
jgi:dihydrodipicolinate synthase/N-acetylneuraminate lyase